MTGVLAVTLLPRADGPVLSVAGDAQLDSASELVVAITGNVHDGAVLPVLSARRVRGTFGSVSVSTPGYSAMAASSAPRALRRFRTENYPSFLATWTATLSW